MGVFVSGFKIGFKGTKWSAIIFVFLCVFFWGGPLKRTQKEHPTASWQIGSKAQGFDQLHFALPEAVRLALPVLLGLALSQAVPDPWDVLGFQRKGKDICTYWFLLIVF